jgi:hypothetical protein
MYSQETICEMSTRAAVDAARRHRVPLVCETEEDFHRIPNIGDYRPDGWKLMDGLFVDSTGVGLEGKPALTFEEFAEQASNHPDDGHALIEVGQFQVLIGRFRRIQ